MVGAGWAGRVPQDRAAAPGMSWISQASLELGSRQALPILAPQPWQSFSLFINLCGAIHKKSNLPPNNFFVVCTILAD